METVSEKYPGVEIVGSCAPEFVETMDADTFEEIFAKDIAEIKKASPDFIWVGLGAPKQELWMMHAQDCVSGLMAGVGAAFDFMSGEKKRAPVVLQKLGLEWFYRLMQDPRRLFPRYFETNIKFLKLYLRDSLNRERASICRDVKTEVNEQLYDEL